MKTIFLLAALLFSITVAAQQQGHIKGNVTDQAMNNEPLLLANVQLEGSDISYQTNFHGNFEISDITPGKHKVVISYAGYETQTLEVVVAENKTAQLSTQLHPIEINFDNVIGMEDTALEEKP